MIIILILLLLICMLDVIVSLKLCNAITSLGLSLSIIMSNIPTVDASTIVLSMVSTISPSAKYSQSSDNILLKRLSDKPLDAKSYKPGILSTDVYYPSWFDGLYKTNSRFTKVYDPLGEEPFGGSSALIAAKDDVGSLLVYNSKFKRNNNFIISDRLYNLKSIAIASMGDKSIIDDHQNSKDLANSINLIVSPIQSNGAFFDINLQVTDREYEILSNNEFIVLERTKQTIRNVIPQTEFSNQRISLPSLQKEIETITLYKKIDENNIFATQRTATYFCKLDPRYEKLVELAPNIIDTAVDVRYYEITYNKL